MSSIALADISACFEGEIPALLATASGDGVPNLGHLSQVFLVDDSHVAISNQFFTKTSRNLAENPLATLLCPDPRTLITYRLLLRHVREETTGHVFDLMRRSIESIAAMTGMTDVFALRSAEVFRVVDIGIVPSRGTVGL